MSLNKSKLAITAMAIASIFAAVGVNNMLAASEDERPPASDPVVVPSVAVTKAVATTQAASVIAYGEVTSRNNLTLTSQVSGQVVYLADKFLSGKQFTKGEVMARIEPVIYQQALASAKSALAEAKLALAQQQQNSEQAKEEWQQSGLGQQAATDLALHKPQLEAAQMKYEMALQQLEKARYDLAQTEITAPFDALVVTRSIQLGSNIQQGAAIAQLQDTALFEVALPLSAQQWQLLPDNYADNNSGLTARITDQTSQHHWQARIDRGESHINKSTRQRALIVAVDQPLQQQTPLFPGSFVKAQLTGERFTGLWQIPASALIDSTRVWQVTEQGVLAYLPVELKFSKGQYAYVKPKEAMASANIVNRPLSSYLEKMKVQAKVEEL